MTNDLKRKFNLRDEDEQEQLVADVWCPVCEDSDLGVDGPKEFEANGIIFLEGKCARCGSDVVSAIYDSPCSP
ncbi:MAG: hypothetical protein IID08_06880 [Candidatus Hydrogenedentes bacterium]|nr:hypothetical protein [Candidatus Hydrogenedentota bacterium]